MRERKSVELASHQSMVQPDDQQMETLDHLANDEQVFIYLEQDESQDEAVVNPDGSISFVRCVCINGVQWRVPVGVNTQQPKLIVDHLAQCKADAQRSRAFLQPGKFQNLGITINRS